MNEQNKDTKALPMATAAYLTALVKKDDAAATAVSKGAWALACEMNRGNTLEEAKIHVRAALKGAKRSEREIDNSDFHVRLAWDIRSQEGQSDAFPQDIEWGSVNFRKGIAALLEMTAAQTVISDDPAASQEAEAGRAAETQLIKKGLQAGLASHDAKPDEEGVSDYIVSAGKRSKGSNTSGTSPDRLLIFLKDEKALKEQLLRLDDSELEVIEDWIEDVKQLPARQALRAKVAS